MSTALVVLRHAAMALILCSATELFAQELWTPSKGPYGGYVIDMHRDGAHTYATTADGGVYRSSDDGASWRFAFNGISETEILSLHASGSTVLLCTRNKGVFRSTNYGESWTFTGNTGLSSRMVQSFAASGSTWFAGTLGGGVCASTDDGLTWSPAGLANHEVYALLVEGNDIYAGTKNYLYVSTDLGGTWTQRGTTLFGKAIMAMQKEGDRLYVLDYKYTTAPYYVGMFSSTDAGITWIEHKTDLSYGAVNTFSVSGADVVIGTRTGVYRSTDGATTWAACAPLPLYSPDVGTIRHAHGRILAGTFKGVYASTDNGASWTFSSDGIRNLYIYCKLDDASGFYVGTTLGGIYRTTNDGETWANLSLSKELYPVASLIRRGANLFACSIDGVYRSSDNGGQWTLIGLNNGDIVSLVSHGGNLFAFSDDEGVYMSTDEGQNWTSRNSGLPTLEVLTARDDSQHLFVDISNKGVYRSADKGNTWTLVGPAASMGNVHAWERLGPVLLAGTGADGILGTTDHGATWNKVSSPPLIDQWIRSLAVNDSSIFAGTSATAAYYSYDRGKTWTSLDSGYFSFGYNALQGVTLYPGISMLHVLNDRVFLGSRGFGLWQRELPPGAPLATPILLSPQDGSTRQTATVPLSWQAAPEAQYYRVQVSQDSVFSVLLKDTSGVPATQLIVTGLPGKTKCFWRVQALAAKNRSPWSAVWVFTTGTPLEAPVLAAPSQHAADVPLTAILSWNPIPNAQKYHVQVASDSAFLALILHDTTVTTTDRQIGPLVVMTKYFWRVRAQSMEGNSPWSEIRDFTTLLPLPTAPLLQSPANSASNISVSPTLTWLPALHAASYHIEVATTALFNTRVIDEFGVSSTAKTCAGLMAGTKYYWRIAGTNATGAGPWSNIWSFTTTASALAAPLLASPVNGASDLAPDTALTWQPVYGATLYRMEVLLSPATILDTTLSTTICEIGNLIAGRTYAWHVMATNASSSSPWSDTWQFSTRAPVPVAPLLQSPADNAIDIARDTSLTWFPSVGATSYCAQVATDPAFRTIVKDQGGIVTTGIPLTGLDESTTYYWRVNAANATGVGIWSAVWSFTTRNATGIIEGIPIPDAVMLFQNYPNPFSRKTTINFRLTARGYATLKIHDALGRLVRTLVMEEKNPGMHSFPFDATGLPGGVYFYRLTVGNKTVSARAIVRK